jgi:hypothetical protein
MQPVRVQIPYTAAEDLAERVQWWITQTGSRRKFKTA